MPRPPSAIYGNQSKRSRQWFFSSLSGSSQEEGNATGHISTDVTRRLSYRTRHRPIQPLLRRNQNLSLLLLRKYSGLRYTWRYFTFFSPFSSDLRKCKMKDHSVKNMMYSPLQTVDILKLWFRIGNRKAVYKKVSFL